jgi:ribokinase
LSECPKSSTSSKDFVYYGIQKDGKMPIAVFGSINMDLVARSARLPKPGETLTGRSFRTIPGGKGANQAVACARLGEITSMIGRVGGDVFGRQLKQELEEAGVDHTNVSIDADTSSGVALIAVEDSAENMIIVIPGANGRVGEEDLPRLEGVLTQSKVLLLQLEIPLESVLAAAKKAKENDVIVILDPAPAQALPDEIYPLLDIITPNESETELLVGFPIKTTDDASKAAQNMKERGVKDVVIKMGKRGAFALLDDQRIFYEPFQVDPVDTVAAGDAFNGALAVALSKGLQMEEAVRWGMAGGALSVTKEGAQPAMPRSDELKTFLQER